MTELAAVRAFSAHEPQWHKFRTTLLTPSDKVARVASQDNESFAYHRQYNHVYSHRLDALKARCWEAIRQNVQDDSVAVNRVLELREGLPSLVVGTLVRETVDPEERPLVQGTKCRSSDQLYLEDESGRVVLDLANVQAWQHCTGVVVGVKGAVQEDGSLQVAAFFPPASKPATTNVSNDSSMDVSNDDDDDDDDDDAHMLIVSGLACGDPHVAATSCEMLLSYLLGQFGSDARVVSRVIIVGPSYSDIATMDGVRDLDDFVFQIVSSGIPVDIVPSATDPTTRNWPQRPLHSSLLPRSGTSGLVSRTPNPYAARHRHRTVIGTDGTNIADLCRSVLIETNDGTAEGNVDACANDTAKPNYRPATELEALQKVLEWSHICPTGPDSVPTVPHIENDPMVLDCLPHIHFSCNASRFASKKVSFGHRADELTDVLLIAVPSFSTTGQVALVNLQELTVESMTFDDGSL